MIKKYILIVLPIVILLLLGNKSKGQCPCPKNYDLTSYVSPNDENVPECEPYVQNTMVLNVQGPIVFERYVVKLAVISVDNYRGFPVGYLRAVPGLLSPHLSPHKYRVVHSKFFLTLEEAQEELERVQLMNYCDAVIHTVKMKYHYLCGTYIQGP